MITETDLLKCKDKWTFNNEFGCWCLEDVIYTPCPAVSSAQRLSIFVPQWLMDAPGEINREARQDGYSPATVPVIFENNSAGYREMTNVPLGHSRSCAKQYLDKGFVYITCGNRGSNSTDSEGKPCGKSPVNLVDLKTAIRFVRHNRNAIPGNFDKMISVGWSAGGAMSVLIGLTGDNAHFEKLLQENGAFMDESDAVYACQVYCPIVDLEHADLAYEWMFSADSECEDSPAGPSEVMTPFKRALSNKLRSAYVRYFNSLDLKSIEKKTPLKFEADGRSGSAYDYFMKKLNDSAAIFLKKLAAGELPVNYSVEDYLTGNYTYQVAVRPHPARIPDGQKKEGPEKEGPKKPTIVDVQGNDKTLWLSWDGEHAFIPDVDTYVLAHRRRMKPCSSFDVLPNSSGENLVFGSEKEPYVHFCKEICEAIAELKDEFPEEYEQYYPLYKAQCEEQDVKEKVYLYNPYSYIGTDEVSVQAQHFRVNVGARDADTSLYISLALACRLAEHIDDVSYNMIWDRPHSEADYEGDVVSWIESLM